MKIGTIIVALVAFFILLPGVTFATTDSSSEEKIDIIRLNDGFYLETVIEDDGCVTNKTIQDNKKRSKVSKKNENKI